MDPDLLARARALAQTQGRLAPSPGVLDEAGHAVLCAAACIAKAGLERAGDARALADFDRRLLAEAKDSYVPALFESLGLDRALAARIMVRNDEQSPDTRLAWFASFAG